MIGVSLDFRKAYDTRGHILNLFKSYLTDRQQFVSKIQ